MGNTAGFVATYHYIRPRNSEGVTGLTPGAFREQVRAIASRYRVVSAAEYAAAEDRSGLALITFDDAVRDQWVFAAPILNELGVPGVFYAPMRPFCPGDGVDHGDGLGGWCTQHLLHALAHFLGWSEVERRVDAALSATAGAGGAGGLGRVEIDRAAMDRLYHYEAAEKRRLKYLLAFALEPSAAAAALRAANVGVGLDHRDWYMSSRELVALRDMGHTIGAHGFDHVPLTVLDEAGQRRDMLRAHARLTEILGSEPRTIAYPFGRRDTVIDGLSRALGYDPAFTTAMRVDAREVMAELGREERPGVEVAVGAGAGAVGVVGARGVML